MMNNLSSDLKKAWENIGISKEEISNYETFQKQVDYKSRLEDGEKDIQYQIDNLKTSK